jgi:ribosomal protein S9
VTKQYGYLKFDEGNVDSNTRLSQYIRLALQTDAITVVEFMQYGWRLPTPDLIISVTGGGKQCSMSAHIRKSFQRGLVMAAATTSKTQILLRCA